MAEPSTSRTEGRRKKRATRRFDACVECGGSETEDMAECDKCLLWTHHSCSGLSEEIVVNKVDKFYCTKCRDKFGIIHEWVKKKELSAEEIDDKARNYYEVAEIMAHKFTTKGRMFTVKWKGYEQLSELPERHLDGCLDLLQDYCIQAKIKPSKIVGLLGATQESKAKFNSKNWVTMNHILKGIEYVRGNTKWGYNLDLEVSAFNGEMISKGVYLLAHDFHCYVVLFLPELSVLFIADGTNSFMRERRIADEIIRLLNTDKLVEAVPYGGQTGTDHCGSSAVLITMEFMRLHMKKQLGEANKKLSAPTWLRKRVVQRMHRYESESVMRPIGLIHKIRLWTTCPDCGKTFIKNDRRLVTLHQRLNCPANKTK